MSQTRTNSYLAGFFSRGSTHLELTTVLNWILLYRIRHQTTSNNLFFSECLVSIYKRLRLYQGRIVVPMCFSGSGPTHFFRSWVRIGIVSTHFLRWIVYYCVCIQHDIDKSQISFIELYKTSRTNSGLRAINSCLHLFWPQLCKACWVNIVLWRQNLNDFHFTSRLEFGPTHIFTQIYAPGLYIVHYTNAYSIAIVISPDLGAFWNSAIRPSVPRRSCLGYRHAGCLQLSHCRPLEMCGLLTRPQTDVYSPRFLPPSNCHRRAGGISSRRPRGDTMSLLLCPEFAKISVRRAADWYFSHSMRSRVYVAVGCPSIHLPVCLSVCPSVLSFSRRTPGLLLRTRRPAATASSVTLLADVGSWTQTCQLKRFQCSTFHYVDGRLYRKIYETINTVQRTPLSFRDSSTTTSSMH